MDSKCGVGQKVIYEWERDEKKMEMKEGVGLRVGGKYKIKYIVIKVKYEKIKNFKGGKKDE